jgi:hypothetical protein
MTATKPLSTFERLRRYRQSQWFNVMVEVTPLEELLSGDGLQPFINLAKRAVAEGIYKRTEEIINLDRVDCDIIHDSDNPNTLIVCRHPLPYWFKENKEGERL